MCVCVYVEVMKVGKKAEKERNEVDKRKNEEVRFKRER